MVVPTWVEPAGGQVLTGDRSKVPGFPTTERTMAMRCFARAVVCCALLAASTNAWAANARDYIPLPDKTFLFIPYVNHIYGNKSYSDGHLATSNANLTETIGILRPVYFTKVAPALYGDGGFVIDPQMLFIFGEAHLDGAAFGNTAYQASGIADPQFLATFWFVNAPKDQLWVGFTPYLTVPLGQYDKTQPLNLGKNRWAFKPEIGIVKGFGPVYLDLIVNSEFYTDNSDTSTSQDALIGAEAHLSYDITKSWFVAADYYYANGGATKVAGVQQHDSQSTSTVGASFFWMVGTNNQLMVQYNTNFYVRNGIRTDTYGARWAYFF